MDFDQLETFLEVARLSSFSRAAERRFRTQPAISAQIRSIEGEVGAKLFDRSGGRVTLTAAGIVFKKYTEDLLELRRDMLANIAETHKVPRGEIVVSANEGTCLFILPEVFAQFKREYPGVAVSVKRSERGRTIEDVLDNSCDFGVVSMPVKDKRLAVVPIHRDELVVITAPGHHLAGHKSATLADVCEYPLLLPKAGRTREALEALIQERSLRPNVSMELDSSELLKRFVGANVGVGFMPYSNVAEEVHAKGLAVLTLTDVTIRRDLALVYRKGKALSRAAQAFIDIAVELKSAGETSHSDL